VLAITKLKDSLHLFTENFRLNCNINAILNFSFKITQIFDIQMTFQKCIYLFDMIFKFEQELQLFQFNIWLLL